mmetsp:Transcript_1439/g.3679  ORF Transcript_1439/g.3679 Transcript_1439/m.3679 type:complete len:394 (-) Transcript_1439:664-1845(-)
MGRVQDFHGHSLFLAQSLDQTPRSVAGRVLVVGHKVVPMAFRSVLHVAQQDPQECFPAVTRSQISVQLALLGARCQDSIESTIQGRQHLEDVPLQDFQALGGTGGLDGLVVSEHPVPAPSAFDRHLVEFYRHHRRGLGPARDLDRLHSDARETHQHVFPAGHLLADPQPLLGHARTEETMVEIHDTPDAKFGVGCNQRRPLGSGDDDETLVSRGAFRSLQIGLPSHHNLDGLVLFHDRLANGFRIAFFRHGMEVRNVANYVERPRNDSPTIAIAIAIAITGTADQVCAIAVGVIGIEVAPTQCVFFLGIVGRGPHFSQTVAETLDFVPVSRLSLVDQLGQPLGHFRCVQRRTRTFWGAEGHFESLVAPNGHQIPAFFPVGQTHILKGRACGSH